MIGCSSPLTRFTAIGLGRYGLRVHRVQGLGLRVKVVVYEIDQGLRFKKSGGECTDEDLRLRVTSSRFKVQGLGLRVWRCQLRFLDFGWVVETVFFQKLMDLIQRGLEPRYHLLHPLVRAFSQGLRFWVQGLRFRLKGKWFRVQGLGFRVQRLGLGFRIQIQGLGCKVQGLGFKDWGLGFGVQGLGFKVKGSGFRVQSPGLRVQLGLTQGFRI